MLKNKSSLLLATTTFILGLGLGYVFFSHEDKGSPSPETQEKKVKYWVAPMDPNYRRDKPGKSPMGMDLVPVYDNDTQTQPDEVVIASQVENQLGVKISPVVRRDLSRTIDTVGYATVDENKIERVTTYLEGWVQALAVKTTGEWVEEGQLLFKLYSPVFVQAQEEYLLALKAKNNDLIAAGENKLKTLGVSQAQILKVKNAQKVIPQLSVFANRRGYVSNLNIREGMFVKPETEIMTIEDLSTIWVFAEVFESQAHWLKQGQSASASFPYWPDKEWLGKVDYVYSELDPKTHTLRARLVFPNLEGHIKPNMYADVKIQAQPQPQVIAVPREALIRTGQEDRVLISLGEGRYQPQPVQVGTQSDNHYQILSGLEEGQDIVVSGQFMIDSESNLRAAFDRYNDSVPDEPVAKEYMAMGEIKGIDLEAHTLLLDHQEIPEIKMPAMEMTVYVDPGVNLEALKVGDYIHFIFIQKDNDLWVTTVHVKQEQP